MTDAARPLTLPDVLEAMADATPERPAVKTIERDYSYAEIDERATRLANHLLAMGVRPGDHVAVHSDNRLEWVDAFYGCLKARAVPININYKYLHDELAYLYDNCDARFAIVAPEFEELARGAAPRVEQWLVLGEAYDAALAAASTQRLAGRSGEDHYVIYTGGTTGQPKGVVWQQQDIIPGALNAARYGAPIESVEKLATDAAANENPMVLMAAGPLMHGGSQWIMGNAHVAGQSIALYTEPHFDAESVLDLAARARVVSLALLGDAMARPVAEAVLAEPDRWDLSGLMAISNGAAPLSDGVREQIRAAFPGKFILDSYGASEAGAAGSKLDAGDQAGAPRFDVTDQVEVLGIDWLPVAPGEEGLLARTGHVPVGYYNDPDKTAALFKEYDGRRWVVPGDMARREEDGTVTVLGRGSVCINTGGEKVHPEEVEATLLKHPDVFDAAVVGADHERWGQQVVALVQLREGATATEESLRAHCHSLIANYKVPKRILIVDAVPRTPVSKVDYRGTAAKVRELLTD